MRLSPLAQDCLDSLWTFCSKECWGLDLEEIPHRMMVDAIQSTETEGGPRYVMEIVPRGFYKTSIARAASVWKILRQIYVYDNLYHRIALCSATLNLGESNLRSIGGQLRYNQKLIKLFGELYVHDMREKKFSSTKDGITIGPRVREGEIATIAEPTFWVGSEKRISTGFHADCAYLDDLNNDKNVKTDHQREQINNYYRLIYPILGNVDRMGRPTQIIMNATPWHDGDVRGTIIREERERVESDAEYKTPWAIVHHNAYNEDGSAWWPTKYSLDELEKIRNGMTANQFAANYLCDPVGDNGFVQEDQIQWKSRDEFPALNHFRATVDPNMHFEAKEIGCYGAIMVSGYDNFANLYFYDARGSREWDSARLIEALFQVNEDYPDIPLLIEDSHMAHFDHAIRLEEANRGKRLRIQWVPHATENKYTKWSKLQPRFRNHRVFIAKEIDFKIRMEIRDELVRGQAARFHDFLDAMAMAEIGILPRINKQGQLSEVIAGQKPPAPGPGVVTFADVIKGMR